MDILATIPLHRLEVSKEEDEAVRGLPDEKCNWFWKLNPKPKNLDVGDRVYFVEDGHITAWCPVVELGYFDFVCEVSGKRWTGYQARLGQNREFLEPIAYRGFQGWRYVNQELHARLDALETKSSYVPPKHKPRSRSDMSALEIVYMPHKDQVTLLTDIIQNAQKNQKRVMVSTIDQHCAEDLSDYLRDGGFPTRFFHTGIPRRERTQLVKEIQKLNPLVIVADTLDALPRPDIMIIFGADWQSGELRTKEWLTYLAEFATKQVFVCADTLSSTVRATFPQIK